MLSETIPRFKRKLQRFEDLTDKIYEKLTEDEQYRRDVATIVAGLATNYNSLCSFVILQEMVATIGATTVNPNENE